MSHNTFGQYINTLFSPKVVQKRKGSTIKYVYIALKLNTNANETTFHHLYSLIESQYAICKTDNTVHFILPSLHYVNGHQVMKTITFHIDGSFSLCVGQTNIDLKCLGLSDQYATYFLECLLRYVASLNICSGKDRPHLVTVFSNYVETWQKPSSDIPVPRMRTTMCLTLLPPLSTSTCCRPCQRMQIHEPVCQMDLANTDKDDLRNI